MKKITKIGILILVLLTLVTACGKTDEEKIKEHLYNKFGEEFVIGYMGGRGGRVIAEIYPKRYIGTSKEYDAYYRAQAFIETNGEVGDIYGAVRIKETAEEFFRPKLEELFGKNMVISLELEGGYHHYNFVDEMESRKIPWKEEPATTFDPLSGDIYIYGRVENDDDREHYREQIFKFIQYMKEEGIFEYIDMRISIIDERLLSKGYNESDDKGKVLEVKALEERYAYINRIMPKYNKSFDETPQEYKDKILENKLRSGLFNEIGRNEIFLLFTRILSKKYVKANGFDRESEKYPKKLKGYDNKLDVDFKWEDYKLK